MEDSPAFPLPHPITVSSPPETSISVGAFNTSNNIELWDQFNKFYSKNEKAIDKCMKTDVRSIALGEKASEIELQIDTFSETTKVVLDGLAGLGKIHPIIGAAVVAFHAVISLDLSRRDNDRKVIAIMLEMQNMMCAMFQLRHLKHTHVQESEMDEEKSRLHRLIESITADIIQCGSDLNYYLGQKFAFKLIKAKNFEHRFKTHVENFSTRRSELQSAIAAYIAGGVDQANLTLAEVSTKLDQLDSKLDYFFQGFLRKLDTPQEKEAFRFFDQNNGVENCISKDDLLARLLTMTGDVLSDSENTAGMKSDEKIKKSRKVLTEEVHLNFEESLKQNTLRFERLLAIQNNNHERVIAQLEKQEGYAKVTVSKLDKLLYYMHPDTKLNDPEVRRIWERMGLKTSVKAKNFVLTFRDHYQHDHSAPPTPNPITSVSPMPGPNGAPSLSLSTSFDQPHPANPADDPNAWLLEYIDVAHVRPIVEAMDADGSGFISVKEINTFARARPKEWSLLQWMVYWAAGWHLNITQYRDKIYDILTQMHELLPSVHPANRVYVHEYLDSNCMDVVESLLRSTHPVTEGHNTQIAELARFYGESQETALRANLKEVSYVISSVADATLVAGPSRAESWIYPLLYLLLDRHLSVIKLGKTHILNQDEINTHWRSLDFVLTVFQQRTDALAAIFSQIYQNVAGRFETFAYGMFHASYKKDTEISPIKNTLMKTRTQKSARELLLEMRYRSFEAAVPDDTAILALERAAPFEYKDANMHQEPSAPPDPDHVRHHLEGYWSATCFNWEGFSPRLGLAHFVLSVASDGTVTGSGEAYTGLLELKGTSAPSGSSHSLELRIIVDNSEDIDYLFHGTYNHERDTVTGTWEEVPRLAEDEPEDVAGDNEDPAEEHTTSAGVDPVEDLGFLDTEGGSTGASTLPDDVGTATPAEDAPTEIAKPAEPESTTMPIQTDDDVKGADEGEPDGDLSTQSDHNDSATIPETQRPEETAPGETSAEQDSPVSGEGNDDSDLTDSAEAPSLTATPDPAEPETTPPAVLADDVVGGESTEAEPAPTGAGAQDDAEADPAIENEDSEAATSDDEEPLENASQRDPSPVPVSSSIFTMRRTPAQVVRFRRNLNLDSETDPSVLAKNRWKFALEATKFQVQAKNMSWEFVRARLAERRLWTELGVSFWHGLITSERNTFMCSLTGEYSPSESRLYETIADYLHHRGYAFKIGQNITCDYCGVVQACVRLRCITCVKDDMSNQIDLCPDNPKCVENPSSNTRYDFVHSPSHTLLRHKSFFHKIHFATFIPQCRTRSENIKKRFRNLEESKKLAKRIAKASKSGKLSRTAHMEETSGAQPLFCVCCEKEVSLPCWICAVCAVDTPVCIECERKGAKIVKYDDRDTMHSHDHFALRINDDVEVQSREVNNVRLQRELINITTDLRSLEQKVTSHLRAASKVTTVLRRFTLDGEPKVTVESASDGHGAAVENGVAAANTGVADAAKEEEDDDLSDIFGSIASSDTESEALLSAPVTPLPAEPQPLPVDAPSDPAETTEDSAVVVTSYPEPGPSPLVEPDSEETPAPTTPVVEGALIDTPTPTTARFFEASTIEHSEQDQPSGEIPAAVNDKEPATEAGSITDYPTSTSTSNPPRRHKHLEFIDSRIASLESSLDTRISSLENRMSGLENQLGEILSLLRQSQT